MYSDKILREQLVQLLKGGNAHVTFDQAVVNFPVEKRNNIVPEHSISCWQLLEHIRISQWDILDFMINPKYKERKFPDDYWPKNKTATEEDWHKTINLIHSDLQKIFDLVVNPNTDFFAPIPHAKVYTIFREVLLVADHNAYHIGQLVLLRKALNIWN